MFMKNKQNNYETLIRHAQSMPGRTYDELKRRYLSYPISLTVHVDKKTDIFEQFIEIHFKEQEAIITIDFDRTDRCLAAYLFFEAPNEEDTFIEYLKQTYDFDFRKNNWLLQGCYLKATNTKNIFCFYCF